MILETERLYLRHFQLKDAPRMSEYRNKKEVAKYQSWKKYSLKDAEKRINHCINHPVIKERENYQFAIVLKESHILIGDIFVEINNKSSFSLGYTLDSVYWNNGYGSEIVSAFINYMKEELGYKKVICYVYKNNQRSLHLLDKLGFEVFSKSFFYDDIGLMKVL
jgi:ribosomal-protein-alanine N-acetyltransferase